MATDKYVVVRRLLGVKSCDKNCVFGFQSVCYNVSLG